MEIPLSDHSRAEEHESALSAPSFTQPTGHSSPATAAGLHAPQRAEVNAAPWLAIAQVVRPHGRHGEVIADVLTDFPDRFHDRTRLWLIPPPRIGTSTREVRTENFWFLRSRVVLKFQGIDSIDAAEGLRDYSVAIPAAERTPVESGSWYAADLIGCRLIDLDRNAEIGAIVDIDRGSSSSDLLVVARKGLRSARDEVLIPFVGEYLVRVDLAERRVEMRLPEGLLDINGPLTDEEKRHLHGAG
jgi:16S rRNA processing protein RimM